MCQVRYLDETSKSFEVKTELRQGDALSLVLFNLVLELVVRYMKNNRSVELVRNRTLLAYADDIVILEKSQSKNRSKN